MSALLILPTRAASTEGGDHAQQRYSFGLSNGRVSSSVASIIFNVGVVHASAPHANRFANASRCLRATAVFDDTSSSISVRLTGRKQTWPRCFP